DLAQPSSEATPPDGALAVPLMKHQVQIELLRLERLLRAQMREHGMIIGMSVQQ
ncbi:hypothetical protein Tco_0326789, partial [Tanacetum coccineum]